MLSPSALCAGVYRVGAGVVNGYLVEAGDRLVVVDAGFPAHYGALLDLIRQLGRSPEDLAAVLLTHRHADHVGYAEQARQQFGVAVWAHSLDGPAIRGERANPPPRALVLNLWRPRVLRTFAEIVRQSEGSPVPRPVRVLRTFLENGPLDEVPGRPLAVHVPGHTAGSAAYYFPGLRALFAGDAVVTRDFVLGRDGPRVLPRGQSEDPARALGSLGRLDALARGHPVEIVLMGHGEPWLGTVPALTAAARGQKT